MTVMSILLVEQKFPRPCRYLKKMVLDHVMSILLSIVQWYMEGLGTPKRARDKDDQPGV